MKSRMVTTNPWPYHDESRAVVSASPERVFAFVDDHERLASHMSQSSWQRGGGRMTTTRSSVPTAWALS